MKKKSGYSFFAVLFCCAFLLYSPFFTQRWDNGGFSTVISWDIYGYYLYLPSLFYDDLGELNNYDYIHNTYRPAGATKDQAFIQPNTGKYVMNYPCGKAILDLPAFAAGHLWAHFGGYKVDGFTKPYQICLCFWCVIIACAGLWIMRKLLLRYFDDWLVAIVIAVISLATNFYLYSALQSLTHAYLFTLYALIMLLTDSFYGKDKYRLPYAFAIGLLSGLATITRPTDIICIIIPIMWGVASRNDLWQRAVFFVRNKKILFIYIVGAFLAASPQLMYWHIYAGHWLFYSYHGADKTFNFLHPKVFNVLFSYKKGWFTYTPVMILSILGFYQLYKNLRGLWICILLFTIINIYLVSSWNIWWYGGFSMRAMIQSYPMLMFPMATFLDDFLRRKYLRYLTAAFLLFCTWLNLLMTYQAVGPSKYGMMDEGNMTRAYYWRLFGRTEITLKDKKLLDADEEMPVKLEPLLKEVYKVPANNIIYSDSTIGGCGHKAFRLDKLMQGIDAVRFPIAQSAANGWFRVYCDVFYPVKEWFWWPQTQFIVQLLENKKVVKEEMIRVQRITDQGVWASVYVEIKTPRKECDTLVVKFWNADSDKVIYINNIKIDFAPL